MTSLLIDCEATPVSQLFVEAASNCPGISIKGLTFVGSSGFETGLPTGYGAPSPLLAKRDINGSRWSVRKSAVELMSELAEKEDELSICTVGPLTNVAAFVLSSPHLAAKVKQYVVLGGAVFGGDITPCAEKNFYRDPEAAAIVVGSRLPLIIVPLEAADDALWAVPLLYLTDPDSLVIEKHNIRIELESYMSRGCSVIDLLNRDKDGAMADIVMRADKLALAQLQDKSMEGNGSCCKR